MNCSSSRQLQQFYYSVAPEYERPGRAVYDAHAGLLESQLSVIAFRSFTPRFSIFFATDFDSYRGAANRDSPLVKTTGGVESQDHVHSDD